MSPRRRKTHTMVFSNHHGKIKSRSRLHKHRRLRKTTSTGRARRRDFDHGSRRRPQASRTRVGKPSTNSPFAFGAIISPTDLELLQKKRLSPQMSEFSNLDVDLKNVAEDVYGGMDYQTAPWVARYSDPIDPTLLLHDHEDASGESVSRLPMDPKNLFNAEWGYDTCSSRRMTTHFRNLAGIGAWDNMNLDLGLEECLPYDMNPDKNEECCLPDDRSRSEWMSTLKASKRRRPVSRPGDIEVRPSHKVLGGLFKNLSGRRVDGTSVADILTGSTTALHVAARAGDMEEVQRLVEEGCTIDYPDSEGHTSLCIAATAGNLNIAKYLIKCGADVNGRQRGLPSPLFLSIKNKQAAIAKLLLGYEDVKVDITTPGSYGEPLLPIDLAVEWGDEKVIALLEQRYESLGFENDRFPTGPTSTDEISGSQPETIRISEMSDISTCDT